MTMATAKLQEAIDLIKKDKFKAKSAKKVTYSKVAKEKIIALIKIIPIKELSVELGVSRSFLEKLKRSTITIGKKENLPSPLKFLEIPFGKLSQPIQPVQS